MRRTVSVARADETVRPAVGRTVSVSRARDDRRSEAGEGVGWGGCGRCDAVV
ncbi:hypothetical protein [Haladaptatus sp. CMAA 1911]|uniref:hypothetical protein n=1 Tax=unclassified Haladaptatus TaxID=2622732 RepID=UPI003754BCD0